MVTGSGPSVPLGSTGAGGQRGSSGSGVGQFVVRAGDQSVPVGSSDGRRASSGGGGGGGGQFMVRAGGPIVRLSTGRDAVGVRAGARPYIASLQYTSPTASGVKPASHHQPSHHLYVFTSDIFSTPPTACIISALSHCVSTAT